MCMLNSFTPEFLMRTLPSLDLDMSIVANRSCSKKKKMTNSVDPDEMAYSHFKTKFVGIFFCDL